METKDIEIIRKVLELSQEDQVEVLNYIDHLSGVRGISEMSHQQQALQEIQRALTSKIAF